MSGLVVCPGSFDPVTQGHVDIVRRASKLFSQVVVLVVHNPAKHCVFSPEERCEMLETVTAGMPNVRVDRYTGLLVDYVRKVEATAIVRGLRALSDFEYEFQMALTNKKLLPEAETVFLTTRAENMYLSSSMVRQIASFGGNISDFVPPELEACIKQRLNTGSTGE